MLFQIKPHNLYKYYLKNIFCYALLQNLPYIQKKKKKIYDFNI